MKLEKAYVRISIHRDSAIKFRSHRYAMSDVDSASGDSEAEPAPTTQQAELEEYNPEGECRVQKKRAPPKQREWIEYGR